MYSSLAPDARSANPPTRLETKRLSKRYPGTQALNEVSLTFERGRVGALIGRNGAGKSTMVKILCGAVRPSSGELLLDGRALDLRSPAEAREFKIATVHQELSLIQGLTVGENILFGRLPRRRGLLRAAIDRRVLYERAAEIVHGMGLDVDVREQVSRLSLARQQMVEIARAMSFDARVVLLDEPTAGLSGAEVDTLFRLVRTLAKRGVAIVYVTHRLTELTEIADTVSVLRDGRHVETIPVAEATPAKIVEMMFGDEAAAMRCAAMQVAGEEGRRHGCPEPAQQHVERRQVETERTGGAGDRRSVDTDAKDIDAKDGLDRGPMHGQPLLLEVRDLRLGDRVRGVSLELHRGEILGVAGMLGAGRTELLTALFGALRADSGEVIVHDDRRVARRMPARSVTLRRMKKLGVALVPEDRKTGGLVLGLSTLDNACLASLDRVARCGVITRRMQRSVVGPLVHDLAIVAPDLDQPVSTLSGGNQQKVVVGKWLNTEPRIMLFDEPTRGIDVRAKRQMFDVLFRLSARGIGSIIVSSELEELLEACHRILVMRRGRIVGEHRPQDLSLERLFALCMQGDAPEGTQPA